MATRKVPWSIFLDQLGADGRDPRVVRGCATCWSTQAPNGGFSSSGRLEEIRLPPDPSHPPPERQPPAGVDRVRSIWTTLASRAPGTGTPAYITGEAFDGYFHSGRVVRGSLRGERRPAVRMGASRALGRARQIPPRRRAPPSGAPAAGAEFLLSRDPAVADYPMGWGNTRPSAAWSEARLPSPVPSRRPAEPGGPERARPRGIRGLANATRYLSKQRPGRNVANEYAYSRKTWGDIERQGGPESLGHAPRVRRPEAGALG